MADETNSQLLELLSFCLPSQTAQIRAIALQSILPFSSSSYRSLFRRTHDGQTWTSWTAACAMAADLDASARHDAIKSLINLTSADQANACIDISRVSGWWAFVEKTLCTKDSILADPIAMLLSNLTQNQFVATEPALIKLLPKLVDLFVEGADNNPAVNSKANFDFLASVLANITTHCTHAVRGVFVEKPEQGNQESAITRMAVFTEHPSIIRRGGVASVIKNVSFTTRYHDQLLSILPRILLPLCGPEEFPLDEVDQFPAEIQLLPPEKQRETDPAIRGILLEALILECSTREARDSMRSQNVYRIIQMLHAAEADDSNKERANRLVGLLIRDEEPSTASVEEIDAEETAMEV